MDASVTWEANEAEGFGYRSCSPPLPSRPLVTPGAGCHTPSVRPSSLFALAPCVLVACGPPFSIDAARDAPSESAADVSADAVGSSSDSPLGPALYPSDRTHSPITPALAAHLRDIAARDPAQRESVFAKIGDSQTVSTNFVYCFAGSRIDLAGRTQLQSTIDHFVSGNAAGANPYVRVSLAATVGWSAWAALAGSPSPLSQEVSAIVPRYAVIMFGTNDLQNRDPYRYAGNLLDIADLLVAAGIIPLFTSVPPRDDDAAADLWVPRYNAIVRGVAQSRQVPFIDLERELRPLPNHGVGPDGIHLESLVTSTGSMPCAFSATGLQHGANIRNFLTLESLDRARRALSDPSAMAPDPSAPFLAGSGTAADPFVVASLPVTDARNTAVAGTRAISTYPGCAAPQDESGPDIVYRFVATRPVRVRAMVFDRGSVDTDVHVLGGAIDGASCIARDDRGIVLDLVPGTYHFVVDTYVSAGVEHAGEYLLVVMEDS